MGDTKRFVAVVALSLIIVAAVVYSVISHIQTRKPPQWFEQQKIERIDIETRELITLPRKEWEALGHNYKFYKNPKTGRYTMDVVWVDPETGEKIPASQSPEAGQPPDGGGRPPDGEKGPLAY